MKLVISAFLFALLIGGANTAASRNFFQFLSDSIQPGFSFAANREQMAVANAALHTIRQSNAPTRTILAYTAQQRPVQAYFFPGTGSGYALVVGGMHGSELSSIEVAMAVVDSLSAGVRPFYNVVVIPALFPDNAALAASYPAEIGSTKNIGRYTSATSADPNRQMPPLGSPFLPHRPHDFAGRIIELENQALLHLIENLHPERIGSIHAIRNGDFAGIFADPRTDGYGFAEGFAADSLLAVQMAAQVERKGGMAPGNGLCFRPTALYHFDPAVAPKGQLQTRTLHGSQSGQARGFGISLGSWASTSGRAYEESQNPRTAAMMFTIEFPGSKRTRDYELAADQDACRRNVAAYASAVVQVMLQNDKAASPSLLAAGK